LKLRRNKNQTESHPLLFLHTSVPLSSHAESSDEKAALKQFLDIFRGLPDPRDPRGVRHDLVFILAASTIAILAGATGFRALADQIADLPPTVLCALGSRWNWFHDTYNCPSPSAIRAVFAQIDVEELERRIGGWLFARARRDTDDLLVLALDGKVLRGAWLDDHQQFTLFSAMIHGVGVPVGQVAVPADTTEVTQVAALIDMIPAPEGTVITADAAHTHATTAKCLKGDHGMDYIFTVKGNQPTLLKELATRFLPVVSTPPQDVIEERGHGRKKRWSLWILPATGIDFPYIEQIACIRRDTYTLTGEATAKEFAFVITSATSGKLTPALLNEYVRGQWGIESKVHWIRDVVWQEDHNQSWKGNTAHVLAALKNLALGAMRLAGLHEIRRTTEWIARDRTRAIPILATP
jgi:predicted transposase YbfD/YdcC